MSITREEIRQLCIAHDRFMAEQASEPIRRPPVSETDDAGLIYKEFDNNALAPAPQPEDVSKDWNAWFSAGFANHFAVERRSMQDEFIEATLSSEKVVLQEVREAFMRRDRRLGELEGELKELKGFVKGLLAAFGPKDKTADIVMLPDLKGSHGA